MLNNHYSGTISPNRFEFSRTKFPYNYRIIGKLNSENCFDIDFDYKFPMSLAAKALIGFGLIVSIIQTINGNWLFPIVFFLVPFLIFYLNFRIKKRKEIRVFTSKFIEFYNREF